jgi:hypothetical protein
MVAKAVVKEENLYSPTSSVIGATIKAETLKQLWTEWGITNSFLLQNFSVFNFSSFPQAFHVLEMQIMVHGLVVESLLEG